jgi:PhnB protein
MDVDKLFNQAISAGATVITPVTEMFLGRQIWTINGSLWSLLVIVTHKEDLSDDELRRRGSCV